MMTHKTSADTQAGVFLLVVLLASLVLSLIAGSVIQNYLSLETRRNSASFFVRNWEDFAKHGVTATISAIIGGIAGFILGHYFR
jgi:hypothetical protein